MRTLFKTMLLWMLLLALPQQAFALAGQPARALSTHALHQSAVAPSCEPDGHAAQHDDASHSHDGTHATGGPCAACCPAASLALAALRPLALALLGAQGGPIAYVAVYLPHVTPEPPEPPPRFLFL